MKASRRHFITFLGESRLTYVVFANSSPNLIYAVFPRQLLESFYS